MQSLDARLGAIDSIDQRHPFDPFDTLDNLLSRAPISTERPGRSAP